MMKKQHREAKMYDTAEEAKQKLGDSVVLFDGRPVYIYSSDISGDRVRLIFVDLPLPKKSEYRFEFIDHPSWDFRSLGSKLGYVNYFDKNSEKWDIVYLSRVPVRTSRQGLDSKTVSCRLPIWTENGIDWSHLLYTEPFIDMFNNKRLSPTAAFQKLMSDPDEYNSISFSKKFALYYDQVNPPNLIYRNKKIGYTEDGLSVKLSRNALYLAEEIRDMEGMVIKNA